ncbi:MAG: hypothetical protein LBP59_00730 [Planctomycetaceae bacterium]|nr:hypothetical protein [Planctomycetaceae bacterium]
MRLLPFRLSSFRIAGVSPAFQDRGHFVGVSSDSQAERLHPRIAGVSPACGCTQPLMREFFDLKRLFVCLSAKCRRDARDPLVSPAFQDRGHFRIASISPMFLQIRRRNACIPGSRASRLRAVVLNR